MSKIILTNGDCGTYEVSEIKKNGRSILIQTDWDYPFIASLFGWNIKGHNKCNHQSTDGTIDCKDCGKKAGIFIEEAREYLDNHIGKVILSDYFENFDCIE